MKTIITLTLILLFSCIREMPLPESNALVINYDSRKCHCLYGWTIVMGNDTILSTSPQIGEVLGYNAKLPVKVKIEAEYKEPCCRYDYYTIKKIQWIH